MGKKENHFHIAVIAERKALHKAAIWTGRDCECAWAAVVCVFIFASWRDAERHTQHVSDQRVGPFDAQLGLISASEQPVITLKGRFIKAFKRELFFFTHATHNE